MNRLIVLIIILLFTGCQEKESPWRKHLTSYCGPFDCLCEAGYDAKKGDLVYTMSADAIIYKCDADYTLPPFGAFMGLALENAKKGDELLVHFSGHKVIKVKWTFTKIGKVKDSTEGE